MSRARNKRGTLSTEELTGLIENDHLAIRVTPNARENCLFFDDTNGLGARVCVSPENGKANAAMIKLLAKALGLPKSNLAVVRGHKSRNKLVAVKRRDN